MAYEILGLGRYTVPAGEDYFSVLTDGTDVSVEVNSNIAPDTDGEVITTSVPVSGGTPTQRGIFAGAQMLLDPSKGTDYYDAGSGKTVTRQPLMVLMTDGEPTFGWYDYINAGVTGGPLPTPYDYTQANQDAGDAIEPDMGIDVLTVATASYWKAMVQSWYYGATSGTVQFFTIGMFYESVHTLAVLDPKNNAINVNSDYPPPPATLIETYNMKAVLDEFIAAAAGVDVEFPVIDYYPPGTTVNPVPPSYPGEGLRLNLIKIQNNLPLSSYFYTDGFFQASDANALKQVLGTITKQVVSQGSYITETEDPNFSGYLTFSDVIGQYMEFKSLEGLWFADTKYTGATFADAFVGPDPDPTFQAEFIANLATQMEITPTEATTVVDTSIAGGILYYNSSTDFGNQLRYYADAQKYYAGPYFNPDGSLAPAPSNAMCVMDLYPISGTVTSDVTGAETDLTTINMAVLTALQAGLFEDADDPSWNVPPRSLAQGQQIVRWYVPSSLIPMRTVVGEEDSSGDFVVSIKEDSPIRIVYSVGLQDSFSLDNVDSAYKDEFYRTPPDSFGYDGLYTFYTNQYNLDSNETMIFCQLNQNNPYYFYVDPSGEVPLYVPDGFGIGNYRLALPGDQGPFYALTEFFDTNLAGYIGQRFTAVDDSIVVNDGVDAPYILSGTQRPEAASYTLLKSNNTTQTRPFVVNVYDVFSIQNSSAISPLDDGPTSIQIRELGNNGLLGIPFTPPKLPQTGDTNGALLGLLLISCAASALCLGLAIRRRKENRP